MTAAMLSHPGFHGHGTLPSLFSLHVLKGTIQMSAGNAAQVWFLCPDNLEVGASEAQLSVIQLQGCPIKLTLDWESDVALILTWLHHGRLQLCQTSAVVLHLTLFQQIKRQATMQSS